MRIGKKEIDINISADDLAKWIERELNIKVNEFSFVDAGGFADNTKPSKKSESNILVVVQGTHSPKSKGSSGEPPFILPPNHCKCTRDEPIECGICGKPVPMKVYPSPEGSGYSNVEIITPKDFWTLEPTPGEGNLVKAIKSRIRWYHL